MPTLAIKTTKYFYFIAFIALLAAGCGRGVNGNMPQPVACTQEAKACPDGSYVGRSGPNCAFAVCPEAATSSPAFPPPPLPAKIGGINGYVHTGPTCPVQKIPPNPACADRPYIYMEVSVTGQDGKQLQVQTDSHGKFSLPVSAGTYTVKVIPVNILPRCEEKTVAVPANQFVSVDIFCDTGIR